MNDDLSIYATRGDIVFFSVSADDDGKPYKFQVGDVVRIKVYGKKDAEAVVLQKDFPVTEITESVDIFLTEEDTKIGEVISKPKDYWYEIELHTFTGTTTIIGYDEEGAKVFKLFPEGDDVPEFVPEPEDIPVVDDELDMASTRPVQNQAIARAFARLEDGYERTHAAVAELHVTPQMYGAIGDGEADDTEAVQAALDSGKTVVLPKGRYKVTTVTVPYGGSIFGKNKDGSVLIADRVNLTTHNTISNFTIEASENATDMVMISAENAHTEYAQIAVRDMRFKGPDSKDNLPNMITLEVSTDYKYKGLYGITFQNIVSNGTLRNAFLFRHIFNADENVWFTNVDISNIFIISALCAMKQEIVCAEGITRQSPLQGFRVSYLNMQNNIGFTQSLFDLYYINQSMFDGCELWDKTGEEDSYIIRNTLSRITILNDRSAEYANVLTVPGNDKSYRELFNTIVCGYTSQASNNHRAGYPGEVIAPTEDRSQSTAPSMPLFNAVCFTNANTTISGATNHFFGAEYFSPNRLGTASIAGVLGFTVGKCPVYATRSATDDEYILQYLYSEAYLPNGTTANRPKDSNLPAGYIPVGYMYFDRTLGKPIWRNNNGQWVDAMGNVV
jgi:hypothetical protein